MRILREDTAAIVVDIQERLMPALAEGEAFLKNAVLMVKGLQTLGIPILVTQQYTQGLGSTVPEMVSCFEDFLPIEKRDFSCCGADEVMFRLDEIHPRNVILFGIESHVCLLQTALDLKEAGYQPVIVGDAVTSRSLVNKELALERFRFEGIMVTSAESLLFELTRSSASPEFKAISKLVK